MLFIIITLIIIVLIIFLTILLLPGMAFFNKMSDQKYNADEKDLLTGILTTAISSKEATGEVMNHVKQCLQKFIYQIRIISSKLNQEHKF